jgi:AraC-like DNA-binding protein
MSRQQKIVIIAPDGLTAPLARAASVFGEVVAFESFDELDRWRRENGNGNGHGGTIAADLEHALQETGCALTSLPLPLRELFDALALRSCTPSIAEVLNDWPSRRSFYRTWRDAIALPPSAFLRRVRALHAERLVDGGMTLKKAAHVAGFSSTDQMRRARKSAQDDGDWHKTGLRPSAPAG